MIHNNNRKMYLKSMCHSVVFLNSSSTRSSHPHHSSPRTSGSLRTPTLTLYVQHIASCTCCSAAADRLRHSHAQRLACSTLKRPIYWFTLQTRVERRWRENEDELWESKSCCIALFLGSQEISPRLCHHQLVSAFCRGEAFKYRGWKSITW